MHLIADRLVACRLQQHGKHVAGCLALPLAAFLRMLITRRVVLAATGSCNI
jgi:hypothetical protein